MRLSMIVPLLMLPTLATAATPCTFIEPRSLELDLKGVRSLRFEVNSHNLNLRAVPGTAAKVTGRACASAANLLKNLEVKQTRDGDRLIIELVKQPSLGLSFGSHDSYLDLQASVPETLPLQLDVGSGDARSSGGSELSADVGSGDVDIDNVKGRVTAKVGSGDLKLRNIGNVKLLSVGSGGVLADTVRGPLVIGSIGSGDLKVATARGPVSIGSVGSGDVEIASVQGPVTLDSLSSGDLTIAKAQGPITIGSIASGDATISDVQGDIDVGSIGSGDLEAHQVSGKLTVKNLGSGDVHYRGVRGGVSVPGNN